MFYLMNVYKSQHFWTTYPPSLVKVVFERPLAVIVVYNYGIVIPEIKRKIVRTYECQDIILVANKT